MTLVAIYFSDPEPEGAPFDKQGGTYRRGYLQLAKAVGELGGRVSQQLGELGRG